MLLTPNELQFMRVFWNADKPLTSAEVLKSSTDKKWKDASLHTILTKLLEKGAIKEHGFVKDGKSISRTFCPVFTSDDYHAEFFSDYTAKDIPQLLAAMMRKADLDAETINQLENIIQEHRSGE